MKLRFYRLLSTLHDEGNAEPVELLQCDSTDYHLLYMIKVKPSQLGYDNEILKSALYFTI